MLIQDVAEVESRNLELLHRHFEKILMPDEDYIQMVEVLISAGASIVRESGYMPEEIEAFEAALRQQAKNYWLATCARNTLPSESQGEALEEALREYKRILKQQRKPKRKDSRG